MAFGDGQVYHELAKLAPVFADFARIDEIWIVNTSILASERWAYFTLMDGRGRRTAKPSRTRS